MVEVVSMHALHVSGQVCRIDARLVQRCARAAHAPLSGCPLHTGVVVVVETDVDVTVTVVAVVVVVVVFVAVVTVVVGADVGAGKMSARRARHSDAVPSSATPLARRIV